jgi:perosamine synthetase
MNIPYSKQTITYSDINAIIHVFHENDMLTCGRYIDKFEEDIKNYVGCKFAVAVNSGTAALHLAMFAIGINKDDEVIVPAISFIASANCILYQSGNPVFCDIDPDTLCIDTTKIEELITPKTKAIIMVDMCGQPCNFDEIKKIAKKYNLIVIQDAAHSLGSLYKGIHKVGSYADITCFSFHPVKNITTCEGGMMITNNEIFYQRAKLFRSHGINRDFKERQNLQSHYYEMHELGFNYRIPDVLCALGSEQLTRIDLFIKKRNEIANIYNEQFKNNKNLQPLQLKYNNFSTYHLYIIKLNKTLNRDEIFKKCKDAGINVNVHYIPIYYHPYYEKLGYKKSICPIAENVYEQILSIPIFPLLKDNEIKYVYEMINSFTLSCI